MPALFAFLAAASLALAQSPTIPRAWNDRDVESYELPLARIGHIGHVSEKFYYSIPVRTIYKTYPVYRPDREPKGYLDWLRQREPEVAFDASRLKTEADWIRAGALVFEAPNVYVALDATIFRDLEAYRSIPLATTPEGILPAIRYVIRKKGVVEYTNDSCAACHARLMPDGSVVDGAQGNLLTTGIIAYRTRKGLAPLTDAILRKGVFAGFRAPWVPQPDLDALTPESYLRLYETNPPGINPRNGTSLTLPVRIPDLIGIRDRKYLDSTGLVIHRGLADIMRYAIANQTTDRIAHFGDYQPYKPEDWLGRTEGRYSDEQIYALALYLYSLQPPPNPNKSNALSRRGERIFQRDGCAGCHPAPLYTNNKLTPARGFKVPEEHRRKYDVLDVVVGTDPTIAMDTRRGTGYYKIPSLKGLWYRGPYEHNGSVATLEDWFDPARLRDDYVPTGFRGLAPTRAVKGHEYGLNLKPDDKAALIAFLRTL